MLADLTQEQEMLRDTVHRLMDRLATPEYIRRLDREQAYPYELYEAWLAARLLRVPFPEEYGGDGGTVMDMVVVAEELAYKSYDFFGAYAGTVFCGLNLLANGTEDQKRHWIPRLLSGETRMSVSISEPNAGSDVKAMSTRAVRDGDAWVVNGQKVWSSGAGANNNVINLYAKTGNEGDARNNVSLFLVDNDTPGVELRKLDMLGRRCVGTYEVFFTNVTLPQDRLVGSENRGWEYLLSGLQFERVAGAAAYCGSAQAVVDMALDYAKSREQFGRPIGSFQSIAHLLADMQTSVAAARALTWSAAGLSSAGRDAMREITMAKLFSSETFVKVANDGMQIMGANGYSMEYDMQRLFRDARGSTIAGGTSQMQRNTIARHMGLKVS
jgi:alkylation response protein AidB-like acyl-CoA dehydrogenase